ncbi:AAA family ATPase [Rhodococcus sp. MTM3W5.2]|uniref:AAA family ATPase n=1 Tax=Rhodococcus sp. MTM3W5.2 TaxID=1805827 RepID=UPI00167812DC|nr:ATP-binding protein [Rhodococcus sp. MTM3W5.2]
MSGFRQFGLVDIDLNQQLTVLTGANGAGKTTILNILGNHFSWHSQFLAAPTKWGHGESSYSPDIHNLDAIYLEAILESTDTDRVEILREMLYQRQSYPNQPGRPPEVTVGALSYRDNGPVSKINVPENSHSIQYSLTIDPQKHVDGIYLSSHRSPGSYQQISTIPATFAQTEQIFQEYVGEIRSAVLGHRSDKSAMLRMKEALLAAAIYGEGNSSVIPDDNARAVWMGFQDVLHLLLPKSLRFKRLVAEPPEIVVETETGRFAIDSISGGISALFELSWQIYLRSHGSAQFTVCFDEPENHLHPSLQRTLIPSLMQAFPNVSFIVATHSPFIVTAAKEAKVYVLRYNDDNMVESAELDFTNKAQSAERTLVEVLGLESTTPIWAEDRFNSIMRRFLATPPTGQSVRRLKAELENEGLGEELPIALELFLEPKGKDQ